MRNHAQSNVRPSTTRYHSADLASGRRGTGTSQPPTATPDEGMKVMMTMMMLLLMMMKARRSVVMAFAPPTISAVGSSSSSHQKHNRRLWLWLSSSSSSCFSDHHRHHHHDGRCRQQHPRRLLVSSSSSSSSLPLTAADNSDIFRMRGSFTSSCATTTSLMNRSSGNNGDDDENHDDGLMLGTRFTDRLTALMSKLTTINKITTSATAMIAAATATVISSATASAAVAAEAAVTAATTAATTASTTGGGDSSIGRYFLEVVISKGIPSLFTIIVIGYGFSQLGNAMGSRRGRKRGGMMMGGRGGGVSDLLDDDPIGEGSSNALSELYNDLYGDLDQDGYNKDDDSFFNLFPNKKKKLPKNSGIPKLQYLKVTNLNRIYDSYEYTMMAATESKASAAAMYRRISFERAMKRAISSNGNGSHDISMIRSSEKDTGDVISTTSTTTTIDDDKEEKDEKEGIDIINSLQPSIIQELEKAERDALRKGSKLLSTIQALQSQLMKNTIDDTMKNTFHMKSIYQLDPPPMTTTSTTSTLSKIMKDNQNSTTTAEVIEGNSNDENSNTTNTTTTSTVGNETLSSMKKVANDTITKISSSSIGWSSGSGVVVVGSSSSVPLSQLLNAQKQLAQIELEFLKKVMLIVGPTRAAAVRTALLGDRASSTLIGSGRWLIDIQENRNERPLSRILSSSGGGSAKLSTQQPRLYVLRFPGDTTASQVNTLREEVTAVLQHANPDNGDEVLLVLETGGGTVTGYGLAAAQLLRLKEQQPGYDSRLKLTICVEQVAASGGYMMCCVADYIIASPFAVLGSIGVIADIPNFYERLKKEGVEFQTVTAGKYKRTLTATKKVTKEDFDKTKEDVEDILKLFRDFVATNRPSLDIEMVATGETWFGSSALERNLCDDIQTVDSVLYNYRRQKGYDVYSIEYKPQRTRRFDSLFDDYSEEEVVEQQQDNNNNGDGGGWISQGIRWLVRKFIYEIKTELQRDGMMLSNTKSSSSSLHKRYMAFDDTADRTRT